MKKIAKFQKVSEEQFIKDIKDTQLFGFSFHDEDLKNMYKKICIPKRATKNSAGYDFFLPFPIILQAGESIKIPTGIRAKMKPNYVLQIYPRSSLGFKYRVQLNNTVGIIDSDYFYSDNEGHIMIKLFNNGHGDTVVKLRTGMAFAQGIFTEYGITVNDDVEDVRNGGFGSTDKRK